MVEVLDEPSASPQAGAGRAGRSARRGAGRAEGPRTRARGRLQLRRVEALDGLRVIGALCVVVYHVMGAVLDANPPATVIMPPIAFTFFVISGFVIYRPFAAAHLTREPMPSARRFWTSRAIRVLPLWWLAVTTYLVVDGTDALQSPVEWIATYALLQFAVPDVRYAVIGPAWALSVEWIFYLLVPVLALAIRAGHRRFAPRQDALRVQYAVLLPMLALAAILPPTRPFMAILVGMVLGVAAVEQQLTRRTPEAIDLLRSPAVATGVTIVAWIGLLFYPYQEGLSVQWVEQDPIIVAIWIVVATVWFGPVAFGRADGPVNRRLGSPFAVRLSLLTFGLYVWHDLVLRQVTEHLGVDVHLLGAMYLTLLGAFAISIFTFVTVEKPMMRLRTHLVPPSSAMAAATASHATDAGHAAAGGVAVPRRKRWTALGGLGVLATLAVAAAHVARVAEVSPAAYQWLLALALPLLGTCALATGFLLHRPWAARQVDATAMADGRTPPDGGLGQTWVRRALGLYPAYWAALAVAVALLGTDGIDGPAAWVRTLAGVPVAPLAGLMGDGADLVAWPLAVAVCSVVLVPLASRLVDRLVAAGSSPARATALVVVPPAAACLALGATSAWGYGLGACTALGMAIATADAWQRAHRRRIPALRPLARRPGLAVALAALAAAGVAAVTAASDPSAPGAPLRDALPVRTTGLVVGAAALGAVAVLAPARARVRRVLGSPALAVLAPLAFGTLLWNDPLLREAAARADVPAALLAVGTIPAAAAAAGLTLRLLQRPLAGTVPPPTRERTPA